jgi:signal transduction histidine kinase
MDKSRGLLKTITDLMGSEKNRYVRVSFQDNGKGMTEEQRKRVFEPFFTTKTAAAGSSGGSGLGMSISYGIIDSHGGSISVQSEPGEGSTFHVMLPAGPSDLETTWVGEPNPAA